MVDSVNDKFLDALVAARVTAADEATDHKRHPDRQRAQGELAQARCQQRAAGAARPTTMPPVSSATAATPNAAASRDRPARVGQRRDERPRGEGDQRREARDQGRWPLRTGRRRAPRGCAPAARCPGPWTPQRPSWPRSPGSAPSPAKVSVSSACSASGKPGRAWSPCRSVATSACTSSFWLVTDTYSPVPMENAPATSAATPVRITVCAETPPPPSPAISEVLVTSPSTAPNTVGRSQPPDTSRCRCDQPAASAACRTA